MYFNDMMFNPQYVNPSYYQQQQLHIAQYRIEQDTEVLKAVKAMHDLCKAVKNMDDSHQQEAFVKCLAAMAEEFEWKRQGC